MCFSRGADGADRRVTRVHRGRHENRDGSLGAELHSAYG